MRNLPDANTETFENVTVFGQPMLFTCCRIDRSTVPKGMYAYDIRHDDECQGDPCEIAPHIMVNHWGTVISNKPVRLEKNKISGNSYRLIDSENEWNYEGYNSTLKEYMAEHPPVKNKEYER